MDVPNKRFLHQPVKKTRWFQCHDVHGSLSSVVDIAEVGVSSVTIVESSVRVTKFLQGSLFHEFTAYLSDFFLV